MTNIQKRLIILNLESVKMKRYLAITILASIVHASFGQTNTIPSSGNVGIGTTTPSQQLTVVGNINIENSTGGKYLGFGVPSNNEYNTIGSLYSSAILAISHGLKPHSSFSGLVYSHPSMTRNAITIGGYSENGIKFYTKELSNETIGATFSELPRMVILNDGNIGIGTISPGSRKLKISTSTTNNDVGAEIEITRTTGTNYGVAARATGVGAGSNIGLFTTATGGTSNHGLRIYDVANATGNYAIYSDSPAQSYFQGNVGIGTTTPAYPLTVDGDIKINGRSKGMLLEYAALSESNGGASTIIGNNVRAGASNNSIRRFANPNDAGSYISLNYYYGITFHTGVSSTLNTDVSSFDNEVMKITQSGNVGIGITNPSEKLSVNGKIRAREIKVETANWPDYVFTKDYKPTSLSETEKHIKEKGHLPGIPSAEEVKANGIDLGEMNAKLLQKLEEVILHLIRQEKEIEKLKEELKKK